MAAHMSTAAKIGKKRHTETPDGRGVVAFYVFFNACPAWGRGAGRLFGGWGWVQALWRGAWRQGGWGMPLQTRAPSDWAHGGGDGGAGGHTDRRIIVKRNVIRSPL